MYGYVSEVGTPSGQLRSHGLARVASPCTPEITPPRTKKVLEAQTIMRRRSPWWLDASGATLPSRPSGSRRIVADRQSAAKSPDPFHVAGPPALVPQTGKDGSGRSAGGEGEGTGPFSRGPGLPGGGRPSPKSA